MLEGWDRPKASFSLPSPPTLPQGVLHRDPRTPMAALLPMLNPPFHPISPLGVDGGQVLSNLHASAPYHPPKASGGAVCQKCLFLGANY